MTNRAAENKKGLATTETTLFILCVHDHICDSDWVRCLLTSCFLPVQSLCEEVNSGTPGPEDPH